MLTQILQLLKNKLLFKRICSIQMYINLSHIVVVDIWDHDMLTKSHRIPFYIIGPLCSKSITYLTGMSWRNTWSDTRFPKIIMSGGHWNWNGNNYSQQNLKESMSKILRKNVLTLMCLLVNWYEYEPGHLQTQKRPMLGSCVQDKLFNTLTAGIAWAHTQHCGYWCPGASVTVLIKYPLYCCSFIGKKYW